MAGLQEEAVQLYQEILNKVGKHPDYDSLRSASDICLVEASIAAREADEETQDASRIEDLMRTCLIRTITASMLLDDNHHQGSVN